MSAVLGAFFALSVVSDTFLMVGVFVLFLLLSTIAPLLSSLLLSSLPLLPGSSPGFGFGSGFGLSGVSAAGSVNYSV